MKSLKIFLQNFWNNSGHFVFLSNIIAKICAFLTTILIIRLLPNDEFGMVTTVFSFFSIMVPFSGLGSTQSLLRFGSIAESDDEKKNLSHHLFRKGLYYQFFLMVIFLLAGYFFWPNSDNRYYIFVFFAVRLLGIFIFSHIQSEQRVQGNNRSFAMVNIVVNSVGFLLTGGLAYYFGLKGYLLGMAMSPFISLFWYKNSRFKNISFSFNRKEIWNYAFHTSGTAALSDTLFALDILLLGWMANETSVASYKVAILLPANITFLSLTFLQSDFPKLAQNYQNKKFLKDYIINYYKLFIPICIVIFGIVLGFHTQIISFFFKNKYPDISWAFVVLFAAFLLNMLLRNLYGNLLSAVGEMKSNTWVSVIALLVLLFSFSVWKDYGAFGMAISQSITLLLTGLFLAWEFFRYFRKLK